MPNSAIVDLINSVDMPQEHKTKALACFDNAKNIYWDKIFQYDWKAPFAMAWIVQKLPWEAEHLRTEGYPAWWGNYDNNVNVNGDRAPWVAGPDGVGVMQPCPLEDTQEARDLCYYAPGHHPRSKWARWIWMGTRNRASQLCYDVAAPNKNDDVELWGDPSIGRNKEGVVVYRMGEYYQLISYKKWWKFVIKRNIGWKISNHVGSDIKNPNPNGEPAAMVYIPWSMQGWTGQ